MQVYQACLCGLYPVSLVVYVVLLAFGLKFHIIYVLGE